MRTAPVVGVQKSPDVKTEQEILDDGTILIRLTWQGITVSGSGNRRFVVKDTLIKKLSEKGFKWQ